MLFVSFLRAKAPLEMGPVHPSHQENVWELGNLVPSKKMELAEKHLTCSQSIGNHTNAASGLGGTFEFFGEKEAHFVKPKKESYIPGEPRPTNNLLNVPLVYFLKRQIV